MNAGFPSDLRYAISKIEVVQLQQVNETMEVGIEVDDGVVVGIGIESCCAILKSVEENEAKIWDIFANFQVFCIYLLEQKFFFVSFTWSMWELEQNPSQIHNWK